MITVEDLISWVNQNAGPRAGIMSKDGVIAVFDDETQEIINELEVDTYLGKGILNQILNKEVSHIPINNNGSIEDYLHREVINEISEKRLMQIILARKALIKLSGYLGETINNGDYLDNTNVSKWVVYQLNNETNDIAVHWSHFDDDSWSIFFKGDSLDIQFLIYEN